MGTTLDKSRPHGTVWGDESGRAFSQDGKYFDGRGDEIEGDFQTAEAAAAAKAAAAKPAKPAADTKPAAASQTDKQLAG